LQHLAGERQIIQFLAWTDIDAFKEAFKKIAPAVRSQEVICFAGTLAPIKGVEYLLEAFVKIIDKFNEALLEIIGRRPNRRYYLELEHKTRAMGLEDRVLFIDELPQKELAKRLTRARALVLPSLSEGLGRVIIEAMACGVPVVCSSVGGIRDIVENGKTGFLVPPGDAEALAEKLEVLLRDRELALRMGEEARSGVEALFSSQAYKEGYRRLFAAALRVAEERHP
jgi:glycosyltransferase involved in cell wall biosynthesis